MLNSSLGFMRWSNKNLTVSFTIGKILDPTFISTPKQRDYVNQLWYEVEKDKIKFSVYLN